MPHLYSSIFFLLHFVRICLAIYSMCKGVCNMIPDLNILYIPPPELDLNQPPAPEPVPQANPQPAPRLSRADLQEEIRKNVGRLRYYQGMLNYWEREMEKALQKERESLIRASEHRRRMRELLFDSLRKGGP